MLFERRFGYLRQKSTIAEIEAKTKALEAAARAQQQVPGGIGPPDPGEGGGGGGSGGPNTYGNQPTGQYWTLPGTTTKVELGSKPNTVAPNATIQNVDAAQVDSFIRQTAPQYGIPADDALAVWNGEGRRAYVGDFGTSFGPYQLHVGGGLGDDFMRTYRADLRDPNTWQQQILYTMAYVQRNGWNDQWHGAPGYPGKGISARKYHASGYLFAEPTATFGLRTGERGMIAENGRPERLLGEIDTQRFETSPYIAAPMVIPAGAGASPYSGGRGAALAAAVAGAASAGPIERVPVPVYLGGVKLADLIVTGREIAVEQGRWSERSGYKTGGNR